MVRTMNFRCGRDQTVTLTVPKRTALPASTLNRLVLARDGGEWTVSCNTPVGGGYGRSLRAILLGLPYKSARRLSGNRNSFLHENFQDPSGDR